MLFILKYLAAAAATAAKSLQSCPTLCDPRDGSPPGSPVPGILQARTLEWVAISFSNAWKWKVKGESLSRVQLLATPWTAAHQAPPSMGFARALEWDAVAFTVTVTKLVFSQKPRIHIHINCSLELFKVLFALLFHWAVIFISLLSSMEWRLLVCVFFTS